MRVAALSQCSFNFNLTIRIYKHAQFPCIRFIAPTIFRLNYLRPVIRQYEI